MIQTETVEVVIRIDKNTFDAVNGLSKFVDDNHIINGYQMKGNSTVGSMITAIANGTVLPKGHGELFILDEEKAKRYFTDFRFSLQRWISEVDISKATLKVIAADKED